MGSNLFENFSEFIISPTKPPTCYIDVINQNTQLPEKLHFISLQTWPDAP